MKRGLDKFQSEVSFLEGLHHREVGRGMMVLDNYISRMKRERREAKDRLKRGSSQEVEINAQIRKYDCAIEKSLEILNQYFNRFYSLCN